MRLSLYLIIHLYNEDVMVESINIFGITSDIGGSFVKLLDNDSTTIFGYYSKNKLKADKIKSQYKNLTLKRIDISNPLTFASYDIPNCEGLLYLVGKSFFSNNVFDFQINELIEQFNLNIVSLISILKNILSKDNCKLKKLVIVVSEIPNEIQSIYHLTKLLQVDSLMSLKRDLNNRGISVSAIKTSWVRTKMFHDFKKKFGNPTAKPISPKKIALMCINEFNNFHPFNVIQVIKTK